MCRGPCVWPVQSSVVVHIWPLFLSAQLSRGLRVVPTSVFPAFRHIETTAVSQPPQSSTLLVLRSVQTGLSEFLSACSRYESSCDGSESRGFERMAYRL